MGLALRLAILGSSAIGLGSLFGGRKDDTLLDDLTPVIAIAVTGFALYTIAKNK